MKTDKPIIRLVFLVLGFMLISLSFCVNYWLVWLVSISVGGSAVYGALFDDILDKPRF